MIKRKEFYFKSYDEQNDIYAVIWIDELQEQYKGIVQIAHGMAEHILRYEEFAVFLASNGFIVCGNDHCGHGNSVKSSKDLGYFGHEEGSFCNMLYDMKQLMQKLKELFPNMAYVLLGHSMGSFLAREFTARYKNEISAALYLGTAGPNAFAPIVVKMCRKAIKRRGEKAKGIYIDKLAFKPFNARCFPKRTNFDWISTVPSVAYEFEKDKKCGFIFTYEGYRDLMLLLMQVSSKKWYMAFPKNLPVIFISGTEDPIGDYGVGVYKVYKRLKKLNCNVSIKFYKGSRHEVLNEKNKKEVYRFILNWIVRKI